MQLPKAVRSVIEEFERLPGIGPKSAQRIAFFLLHHPQARLDEFGESIKALKRQTVMCSLCHNVGEEDPCSVCSDPLRDHTQLMVVEQPFDILSIERSQKYHGVYHVLHGVIAPLNNIGPEHIFLYDIAGRLDGVEELIMATNPTLEGEATGMFISEFLRKKSEHADLKITRLGHGLPIGADIEYADGLTIARALEGRRNLSG